MYNGFKPQRGETMSAETSATPTANGEMQTTDSGFYPLRFDRMEIAGSLGDLGTLLPLAIGMILVCGLSPVGLFLSVGLFYIASGLFFRVTVPVQPMKVVSAYAIAAGVSAVQVEAAGLLIGLLMVVIGATGLITAVGRVIPKSAIRGVQLSTGVLLMAEGVRFMIGTARFQEIRGAAEPWLAVQRLGPLPIGVVIGVVGAILTFMLLENRKMPAGQVVILFGLALGLALGTHEGWDGFRAGLTLPTFLPDGLPGRMDLGAAILFLVLPQVPMTVGNAVMAYSDLSADYFGPAGRRVTYRSACVSMGLANLFSSLVGGMPMCHGAGGLAAHYRFGARTAGSNLIIGGAFVALALFLGEHVLTLFYLLPMSILGVLLFFAGTQLGLTAGDLQTRKDLFVALTILGITLATNLAAAFAVGIAAAYALKSEKFQV